MNEAELYMKKEHKFFNAYEEHIELMRERFEGLQAILISIIINLTVTNMKLLTDDKNVDEIIEHNITQTFKFEHNLQSKEGLEKYFDYISDKYNFIDVEYMNKLVEGKATV